MINESSPPPSPSDASLFNATTTVSEAPSSLQVKSLATGEIVGVVVLLLVFIEGVVAVGKVVGDTGPLTIMDVGPDKEEAGCANDVAAVTVTALTASPTDAAAKVFEKFFWGEIAQDF